MNKIRYILITLCFTIPAAFLARTIWPYAEQPNPELSNFFSAVTVVEALLTGIGIAFVIYILSKHRRALKRQGILGWTTFISIAWILISGYPHDNSHLAHGAADLHGLVSIEIFYHGTLAIAAIIVMLYFLRNLKQKK